VFIAMQVCEKLAPFASTSSVRSPAERLKSRAHVVFARVEGGLRPHLTSLGRRPARATESRVSRLHADATVDVVAAAAAAAGSPWRERFG
jgi:hypothetical protein